jgi:CRP/FNR family cyclic AMP-dependent transcriptional regulator
MTVPSVNVGELLAQSKFFRHFAPEERDRLISQARFRECAADETIFSMGSPGDSMMVVLTGSVRISVSSPEGKEIVVAVLGPGEILGEIALLDTKERTADARATTECILAVLQRRDVFAFFERHPSAWRALVEVLCERLRRTDQQVAEMALLTMPVRLARAMLRISAGPANSQSIAEVRISQQELGFFVGATREAINKCLGDWQRKNIIRVADGVIIIVNRPALEALAQVQSA